MSKTEAVARTPARTNGEVQRLRNNQSVRFTRIANGYSVTECGTGDIYSYGNLDDALDHVETFFEKKDGVA